MPLIITGWSRAKAIARAREILAAVALAHRTNAFPSQLSTGQQQRVAIARALINEPRLLVCDEPTAALDAQAGNTVMELIKQVAVQPERAVIVVTHDNGVFGFGDHTVEMSDGRIDQIEDRLEPEPASGTQRLCCELALRFVRVEPFVVPKKSLTGENTERVDTRVLQVIYAVESAQDRVYVGQQLDVFIRSDATI